MQHDWRRFQGRLKWHTFEWRYTDDRSERWRACHYCGREDAAAGIHPVIG